MVVVNEIKKQIATLMTGAFAFVAALVWKDAIMEWMRPIIETGEGAVPLTIVAIVVTFIAVFATYMIGKTLK